MSLGRLESEISELAAHLNAAMCRWLALVAEFNRREGHVDQGFQHCSTWLAWRCSITRRAAQEHVRVARRLRELPLVERAFARGELSYSKVRALTRMPDETQQPELLELALHATASQLERIVRTYRRVDPDAARRAEALRHCSWHWEEDGSLRVSARLGPDEGAMFLKALAAGRDAAVREARTEDGEGAELIPGRDVAEATTADEPQITNADALAAAAEMALTDAAATGARSGGDAYQVVLHLDREALRDRDEGRIRHLEQGPAVAAATARRLTCDASFVSIHEDADGEPLSVGRKTRSIPPSMRRALRDRDGGCRFPGCANTRFVDGHHIRHWAQGGETSLENLVQLCRRHHRLVHEGGFTVERCGEKEFLFRWPSGLPMPVSPPAPRGHLRPVLAAARRQNPDIDASTCMPRSRGDRLDLELAVTGLFGVAERSAERAPP